jgi:hypothetical protein
MQYGPNKLYEHLLSKDMSHFWRVRSSKMFNNVINISYILMAKWMIKKLPQSFVKKFSEPVVNGSSFESYCDKLRTDESVYSLAC